MLKRPLRLLSHKHACHECFTWCKHKWTCESSLRWFSPHLPAHHTDASRVYGAVVAKGEGPSTRINTHRRERVYPSNTLEATITSVISQRASKLLTAGFGQWPRQLCPWLWPSLEYGYRAPVLAGGCKQRVNKAFTLQLQSKAEHPQRGRSREEISGIASRLKRKH